jgi:5-formyltetrahydrofolate cyclo-ligase
MSPLQAAKQAMRQASRARLAGLSAEAVAGRSQAIRGHLEGHHAWRSARVVMAFAPLPGEPDVVALLVEGIRAGKVVALPRVDAASGSMEAVRVRDWGLEVRADALGGRGVDRVARPAEDGEIVGVGAIDLVLVPGLAFDRGGRRLGRGGGFYDRFLARLPAGAGAGAGAVRLGVGFEVQVVDMVPSGSEDCTVHAVVTEAGTLERS